MFPWELFILALVYLVLEAGSWWVFGKLLIHHTFELLGRAIKHLIKEILRGDAPERVCALLVSVPLVHGILATIWCTHHVFLTRNACGAVVESCFLTMCLVFVSIFLYHWNFTKCVPWLRRGRRP